MKESNNKEGLIVNKLIVSIDRFVERFLIVAKDLYPNESDYTEDSSYYTFKHLSSTLNAYNHAIKNYLVGVEKDYYNGNLYFTFDLDSLISSVDLYSNKLNSNRLVYIFNVFSNKMNRILFDVVIKDENGFYILNYRYTDHPLYANFRSYAIDISENIKASSQFIDNESSESWKIDLMNDELLYLNNRLIEETIKSFNLLERSKQDLNSVKKEIDDKSEAILLKFKKDVDTFFSDQSIDFEKNVNKNITSYDSIMVEIYNKYKDELVNRVEGLSDQVSNSKNEVDNLDQAIKSYKSTVSRKIQNEISKHYQDKAKMEMWTYWGATFFSILLILGSLGLLAWGLFDYYNDYISTNICLNNEEFKSCVTRLETIRDITKNIGITFFIMRFSFSLLLFLTVIYTSRIAIRAYSHWRHSENMHLKLSSLEPFITELPEEVRHEIHRELIPDYFGKDAGLVDNSNEKFKDLPTNISAVAMKAIEQISGSGSNSSTEKNGKKSERGAE